MPRWPWNERTFNFDYPARKFPEILERLRGTPARVAALTAGLPPDTLAQSDGQGWSVQQNIGHLADVHRLMFIRLDEFLAGAAVLSAADQGESPNARHRPQHATGSRYSGQRAASLLACAGAADWTWAAGRLGYGRRVDGGRGPVRRGRQAWRLGATRRPAGRRPLHEGGVSADAGRPTRGSAATGPSDAAPAGTSGTEA